MTQIEWEAFKQHKNSLPPEALYALKQSELERMAYGGIDPLDTLCLLESLKLLYAKKV